MIINEAKYGIVIPYAPEYSVTKDGRVFSHKQGKAVELCSHSFATGYKRVNLCQHKKGLCKYIHSLVLELYSGPRPEGYEARHLNGDRTDNHLSNLIWGTPKENASDKTRHGTTARGENHGRAKLTNKEVVEIRQRAAQGEKRKKLAKEFGVKTNSICNIVNRRTWDHV